jgi:DNA polymerase-4
MAVKDADSDHCDGWPDAARAILHVDMDAFFAAIAVLDDPSLRGKAVLTGGSGPRGVVTTASYEARKFGCRSAMPTARALKLCPHAICVKVPGQRIREVSDQLFAVLDEACPQVQPLSVDEAFLDITGQRRLDGEPVAAAARLKQTIRERLGLTASIGVAPNKFLAKLGSDLDKPDGLTVIHPDRIRQTLDPLPIERVWGVGPAAAASLHRMGVRTIGQLRTVGEDRLVQRFGSWGRRLGQLARGEDDRPVRCDGRAKSIGHEQTFGQNLDHPQQLRDVLLGQATAVGRRLRRKSRLARGVVVKIRYGDFQTITRSTTLDRPSDIDRELYDAGVGLFNQWAAGGFRPVRLIGLTASPLTDEAPQLQLFEDPRAQRQQRVDRVLDQIADKFGQPIVHRGAGDVGRKK